MKGQIPRWDASAGVGTPGPSGPAGPAGATGPPGPAGAYSLEQSFAIASTTWVVTHNQGTKGLNVYTENALGHEIEGLVTYPDDDHIHIDFFHAQTGLARVWN